MDQDNSRRDDEHSMDAVRDLLFGKKNQESDERFDSLEKTLLDSINRVEERMNGRMDSLDHFVKGELNALRLTVQSTEDKLRGEVENRKFDLNSISDVLGALDSKCEEQLKGVHGTIDHLGSKSREELYEQVNGLKSQLDTIREEFGKRMNAEIEKLSASAAHRSDLSGFLIDLGMKYRTRDGDAPEEDTHEDTVELHG